MTPRLPCWRTANKVPTRARRLIKHAQIPILISNRGTKVKLFARIERAVKMVAQHAFFVARVCGPVSIGVLDIGVIIFGTFARVLEVGCNGESGGFKGLCVTG